MVIKLGQADYPSQLPIHPQASKFDAPDLLQVVDLAFGDKPEGSTLWEMSGKTLRLRFKELLRELQLPLEKSGDMKPLDLGSLRAGGATWPTCRPPKTANTVVERDVGST